jgi:hypothetical protein
MFRERVEWFAQNHRELHTHQHHILLQSAMTHLTPQHKHSILLEYHPRTRHHSFAALARRHDIKGGKQVLIKWHAAWNGTVASLEERRHSGRPRILSAREVTKYVAPPIRAKNRKAQAVHYTDIQPVVEKRTGKRVSLRTIQHYGKEELDGRCARGKKRTAEESESTHTSHIDASLVADSR